MRRLLETRGAAIMVWVLAGWPVWHWYALRMVDGSDEPWGAVALLAALVFVPWRMLFGPLPRREALGALAIMMVAVLGIPVLPALVRGGLWMLALVWLLGPAGPAAARGGLLLLSLPVVATAQFYLGYPLRVVTAACSVPILRLLGFAVERDGTALRWAGELVLVDAPCSGIQMLWTGLFTSCVIAAARGLGFRETLRLGRAALALVALANLLRCVALFVVGVRSEPLADWLHQGIGLALFGVALFGVAARAKRLLRLRSAVAVAATGGAVSGRALGWTWVVPGVGVVLCGAGVWLGAALPGTEGRAEPRGFPGWPDSFEGRALRPLVLGEREKRFAAGFPGRVGVFNDGERTILLRWVGQETRKLHPALHCLRGLGYSVEPGPVRHDGFGANWGTTIARRGDLVRHVRERIYDETGREWTDVSAWWWDAWLGRSRGPWWAATVFEG